MNFSPMRVGEQEIFTVDFARMLGDGELIIDAVWSVELKVGRNNDPLSMIKGVRVISGTTVSQMIEAQVVGTYAPICTATTSLGQVISLPEVGEGLLTVRT